LQDASNPFGVGSSGTPENQHRFRGLKFGTIPNAVVHQLPHAIAHAVHCNSEVVQALALHEQPVVAELREKVDVISL
jgi:hypothetical protein